MNQCQDNINRDKYNIYYTCGIIILYIWLLILLMVIILYIPIKN